MNQREKARVSGVCTVMCAWCVFGCGCWCVCVSAVGRGSRSTIKDFNMSSNSHKHRACLADTTGQMFISNQYEHKEIRAVLSYVIYYSMAPANILHHILWEVKPPPVSQLTEHRFSSRGAEGSELW